MPLGQPISPRADYPRTIPLAMPWWYRADSVHLVGSKSDIITDLSGNSNDSLQAVDANRFVWSATSGPNNTPGLTGSGTQFSTSSTNVNLSAVTQLTVIAIVVPNALPVGATPIVSNFVILTNAGFNVDGFNAAANDSFDAISHTPPINAPLNNVNSANPAAPNSPAIVEATMNQTLPSNQNNVWINGVLGVQNRPVNGNVVGGFQSLPISLGVSASLANCWRGVIAECFSYIGFLTAQQRQNLYRGYLSPRYGIAVP